MTRTVLLRLSDSGEPINFTNEHNGVLILPETPLPMDHKEGNAIFNLSLQITAASPISRGGIVWSNVPPSSETPFVRSKFYKHVIVNSFHKDISIDIPIYKPGAYCYYISYNRGGELTTTRKFYFNSPPNLTLNGEYVPVNSLNLQSVISKWMGPLSDWDAVFSEISKKGYNMIHFTPLQQRGDSDSPYSIYDQLKFDPAYFKSNEELSQLTQRLSKDYGILSLTDVVWNHTANNSEWLTHHPEAGYNRKTAPHLISAIELDGKLLEFSSKLTKLGYPTDLKSTDDLLKIMEGIKIHVLGDLKLWQFYTLDVDSILMDLKHFWENDSFRDKLMPIPIPDETKGDLTSLARFVVDKTAVKPFGLGDRYSNKLDSFKFAEVLCSLLSLNVDFERVEEEAVRILDEVNLPLYKEYDDDVNDLLEQIYNRTKYLRIDGHGPKMGKIDAKSPLAEPYFTRFKDQDGIEWALANNGWIWNSNPLVDFASAKSKAYLRREVIVWGDCVKLRYGTGPEDSPYVWERMSDYTRLCASTFDGFRIDNCHSTPLHVGEYLLDVARSVNPNLYVIAELFSGSERMDRIYVERLGLNALIREAMQSWSVEELSRIVHRNGGRPIGSLTWLPLDEFGYPAEAEPIVDKYVDSISEFEIPRILSSQVPRALFMDCTHDNEMPYQKRTVEDTLPNAALVAFCSSAIGSVFGYDECYPHLLDVVQEKREYTFGKGIGTIKTKLHEIRKDLAFQSIDHLEFNEMHVHHEDQYITIQRTNAKTGKGYFLVARTKFHDDYDQWLNPVKLAGTKIGFQFAYGLKRTGDYKSDDKFLNSVPVELVELDTPKISYDATTNQSTITLPEYFPQGSIAVFNTEIPGANEGLDDFVRKGAIEASKDLSLYDLNALLYKCESEERDASAGTDGVYYIPGSGALVYAGLQGWISVLKNVIWHNDLAHPFINHLRQGEWALDYIVNRLTKFANDSPALLTFKNWLSSRIQAIRKVPFFLRPRYFALTIGIAYEACRFRALNQMSGELQNSTNFLQSLALTSVQMVGKMRSTSLKAFEQVPCLAAGLPHFSYDYMRCWGRDVFISFRGLLLVPGRYDDAKLHILSFAQTLKHGLIPNLLDAGRNPRYNARDAVWFFVQSIQDYVEQVPGGESILDEKVKRRFPLDDTWVPYDDPVAFSYETSIRDVIYEILVRHAGGIKYREANAGPNLDSQMRDQGFDVEVKIDWETGLPHGGSQWNCGTWMDKMGESERAGSKGVPGTPRDGAAIELSGLLKSALRFANDLNSKGLFEYTDVVRSDTGDKISLKEWEALIQDNFEKCYYIPEDSADDENFNVDPSIINRRGIYKDLYKSGKPYEDYQLRPNFAISMVVSPELFTPSRALKALQIADQAIRGPVGMRTLDPSDLNYRPYYRNSEDNEDFATSKGRNYHQGPEWVWCMGYFLRAFLQFHFVEHPLGKDDEGNASHHLLALVSDRLDGHRKWIRESPWAGLAELTNKDGELCDDSSPTQAWSGSCLLDLYYDLWSGDYFK